MVMTLLAFGLTACGFHLAGTRPLPDPLLKVAIDVVTPSRVSEPPLETSLRSNLRRRGAEVVETSGEGVTNIRLSELHETRDVLSIGTDGKALEFRLVTSVRYEVRRNGKLLSGPDTLRATRDYSFQPQQVLAKEAEEARLREFIQAELAELLMLRLEVQLQQPAAVVPGVAPDAAPVP
jgi:LPS-assembly lipoprotein